MMYTDTLSKLDSVSGKFVQPLYARSVTKYNSRLGICDLDKCDKANCNPASKSVLPKPGCSASISSRNRSGEVASTSSTPLSISARRTSSRSLNRVSTACTLRSARSNNVPSAVRYCILNERSSKITADVPASPTCPLPPLKVGRAKASTSKTMSRVRKMSNARCFNFSRRMRSCWSFCKSATFENDTVTVRRRFSK